MYENIAALGEAEDCIYDCKDLNLKESWEDASWIYEPKQQQSEVDILFDYYFEYRTYLHSTLILLPNVASGLSPF